MAFLSSLSSPRLGSLAAFSLGALAVMSACSSGTNAGTGTGAAVAEDGGGSVGCTGGEAYSANMTKAGANNAYTFTLVQASPAPPSEYTNAWTLKVVDASGKAPAAASLSVNPRMPQMGHGSNQVPTVTANADGTFDVKDIYFTMPGLWSVTFTVSGTAGAPAGDDAGAPQTVTLDSAAYSFCID